jgi:oligosaccharyltransferase complex subunit gamma
MARSGLRLLLALCLVLAISGSDDGDAARIARVQTLQRAGIVELDAKSVKEVLVGKSRPYSVFLIADAKDLRSSSKLKLGQVVADFRLAAKTYASTHRGQPAAGSVVFARMEFSKVKELFGRLGVQSLPYMARVPPGLAISEGGAITLPREELMSPASYPWTAEAIAEFVTERSGLPVGKIERSPLISARLMPVVSLAVLGGVGSVGYKLYYAPFMRHQALYAAGALVIYWFSVSGGMFNIIRGVPLVGYDARKRQAMLFMAGQGQLGAEGFIMGSLYTLVGLAVAGLIFIVPKVKDAQARRYAAYGLLALAFLAFRSVTANHLWKTGMQTHWYWP